MIPRFLLAATVFGAGLLIPQEMAWSAPETRFAGESEVAPGEWLEVDFPATHIGVRWNGSPDAVVQLQGQKADGTLSDWRTAEVDEANGGDQEAGLVIVDDAVKLRTRVLTGTANEIRLTAIDTENGPRRLVPKKSVQPAAAVDGATPIPSLLRRSQWGANESLRSGNPSFAKVNRVIVHHTATNNSDPNPAATVRAILSWHTQGNGWSDIGYNYLIDRNGVIYEGRYSRAYADGVMPSGDNAAGNGVIGAHAIGANTGSIGISLLGTYTTTAPTAAQQAALTKMIAWTADKNGFEPTAPGKVVGHRDVGQTACPGAAAMALMPTWRTKASNIKLLASRPGNTPGYWIAGADGSVKNFGAAKNFGSMAGKSLGAPIIGLTRTPTNDGYWLLGADGGIFSFGDAKFFGSTGAMKLNQPIVSMTSTPTGNGYWLVAKDGGIFSFGDAKFFGSTGNIKLNQPVVTMAATPTGKGYWLAASDGGIFAYGDATFHGSTGHIKLAQPITTMTATANGYLMFANDGGVFAFNAPFYGSVPMLELPAFSGAARAAVTSTGKGYYVLGNDGAVYTFGDARFHGAGTGVNAAGISVMPA